MFEGLAQAADPSFFPEVRLWPAPRRLGKVLKRDAIVANNKKPSRIYIENTIDNGG